MRSNGIITHYQLQCSGGGQEHRWTVMGSQTTTILSGLLTYTNYSCSITAHTSVGEGPAATIIVTTRQDGELIVIFCIKQLVIGHLYMQFQVDHLGTCLLQLALIISPFPGLLHSSINVMESSSAILSPVAQETSSSTLLEPAAPV